MGAQILDYSGRAPQAADVKAAGYVGASRYLAWQPNPKVLTPAEARDYWLHGLSLAAVWEVGTDPTSSNPAQVGGEIDRQMREDGFPDGWGFYLAMDEDCPQSEWAAYAGWGDACSRAARRPWRGYCMSALGEQLVHDGHFNAFWDPYAWSGEDGQKAATPSPHAALFQRLETVVVDGTACDVNDVLSDDWFGFKPGANVVPQNPAAPTPAPVPAPLATASSLINFLGASMTPAAFVRACYLFLLHREPETVGHQQQFEAIYTTQGDDACLAAIADSMEGATRLAQMRALLDAQKVGPTT